MSTNILTDQDKKKIARQMLELGSNDLEFEVKNIANDTTLVFNNLDGENTYRLSQEPAGLSDAKLRQSDQNLADQHGIFSSDVLLGKRSVTFEGTIIAESEDKMIEMTDGLRKAFVPRAINSQEKYSELRYTDYDGLDKIMYFQTESMPEIKRESVYPYLQKFTVTIKAPDPRILSQEEYSSTSYRNYDTGSIHLATKLPSLITTEIQNEVTLVNQGNFMSSPLISIQGPAINPEVTNVTHDLNMKFELTLGEEEILVINVAEASAKIDGDDALGNLSTDSEWLWLITGENLIQYRHEDTDPLLTNANPTSTVTVQWQDVWV